MRCLSGKGRQRGGCAAERGGRHGPPHRNLGSCVGEGGELSGEVVGGAKMLNTVGALTRSAGGLWQAHAAVTWWGWGTRLGVGVTLGPLEGPDLIMGLGSGLLGAVLVSHLETFTWPREGPGCGVLHPAPFLSDYFV